MIYNIPHLQEVPPLAKAIAAKFAALPQVVAVALAGSRTSGAANEASDYDFYVYIQRDIPLEIRQTIAQEFAERIEINNQFWETGDEWIDIHSGSGVDVMYRTPQWIEEQIDRVLVHHQASVGYSTCFWWNILTSVPLYEAQDWLKQLQEKANKPYPEKLKMAVIAKNYPILRHHISAYTHQLEVAIRRKDCVSIIHRTSALLASYFDVIFAVNSAPHPGEKRLVEWVNRLCIKVPNGLEEYIQGMTDSIALSIGQDTIESGLYLHYLHGLIDGLEQLLLAEGLITESGELVHFSP